MRNRSMLLLPVLWLMACGSHGAAAAPDSAAAAATAKADSVKKDSVAKAAKHVVHRAPIDTAAAAGMRPLVRETYQYQGSSHDPFQPMVVPVDHGPELADLRLVAILYDPTDDSGSLATFRDIGNDHRYTVAPGQRLGRIAVVSMTANTVKLREDDFGTPRDQTYALRKPEEEKP